MIIQIFVNGLRRHLLSSRCSHLGDVRSPRCYQQVVRAQPPRLTRTCDWATRAHGMFQADRTTEPKELSAPEFPPICGAGSKLILGHWIARDCVWLLSSSVFSFSSSAAGPGMGGQRAHLGHAFGARFSERGAPSREGAAAARVKTSSASNILALF